MYSLLQKLITIQITYNYYTQSLNSETTNRQTNRQKKMDPQQISEKSWTDLVRSELSKEKDVIRIEHAKVVSNLNKELNLAYNQNRKNMDEINRLKKENEKLAQDVEFHTMRGKEYYKMMQELKKMETVLEKYKLMEYKMDFNKY